MGFWQKKVLVTTKDAEQDSSKDVSQDASKILRKMFHKMQARFCERSFAKELLAEGIF
jgi:hypothetical protein